MKKLKVGDIVNGYNDGKVCESRRVSIRIVGIVDRIKLSKYYWKMWRKALKEDFKTVEYNLDALYDSCREDVFGGNPLKYRFWDWGNRKFIFGEIIGDDRMKKDPMVFAKRPNGEWYGVNYNYLLQIGD